METDGGRPGAGGTQGQRIARLTEQLESLTQLVEALPIQLQTEISDLRRDTEAQHRIQAVDLLPGEKPPACAPYRMSPSQLATLRQ